MKKINKNWLKLVLGITFIFFSVWILFSTQPDPLRDTVRFSMEILPFILILIYGILLFVKSVLKIKEGDNDIENTKNKALNIATKITGALSIIGMCLFLVPIIYIMIVLFYFHK